MEIGSKEGREGRKQKEGKTWELVEVDVRMDAWQGEYEHCTSWESRRMELVVGLWQ